MIGGTAGTVQAAGALVESAVLAPRVGRAACWGLKGTVRALQEEAVKLLVEW